MNERLLTDLKVLANDRSECYTELKELANAIAVLVLVFQTQATVLMEQGMVDNSVVSELMRLWQ